MLDGQFLSFWHIWKYLCFAYQERKKRLVFNLDLGWRCGNLIWFAENGRLCCWHKLLQQFRIVWRLDETGHVLCRTIKSRLVIAHAIKLKSISWIVLNCCFQADTMLAGWIFLLFGQSIWIGFVSVWFVHAVNNRNLIYILRVIRADF